jgi:phosphoglycolate phosphatase
MTGSPRAYDYWLFDLDGTLVDADWSYTREVFDRVGDALGRRFTDREAAVLWHGFTGSRDDQLREWEVEPAAFWSALDEAEDAAARAEATVLHDDAAALLEELWAAGRPVGVVTHCAPFLAEPVLDCLGVRDRFGTVVCCDDDLGWKPDPAPVERAMADLGVDGGDRGVLVGDGAGDVGAAWNAGLDAVHVERHGPERRGRCVLADRRVESFAELGAVRGAGSP